MSHPLYAHCILNMCQERERERVSKTKCWCLHKVRGCSEREKRVESFEKGKMVCIRGIVTIPTTILLSLFLVLFLSPRCLLFHPAVAPATVESPIFPTWILYCITASTVPRIAVMVWARRFASTKPCQSSIQNARFASSV